MAAASSAAKRPRRKSSSKPSHLKLAAADGFCMFVFVLVSATFVELAPIVAARAKLDTGLVSLTLIVLLLLGMLPLTKALGGASVNPALNAALYAVGKGTLKEHAVRTLGQAAGGIAGAAAAHLLLPSDWHPALSNLALGLRPGVGLLGGAACEAVLGSLLAFVLLYSGELQSSMWQVSLPLVATVVALKAGEGTSGPSLNPAFSLAWHLFFNLQSLEEHVLVFWVVPILSGLFGGWAYLGWQQRHRQQHQQARTRRAKAD